MIRLVTALCKSFLKELTERMIFQKATDEFSCLGERCPKCGAKGKLSAHGDYSRGLTTYEDNNVVDYVLRPPRAYCSSCSSTHALLPDIIVPYSTFSLMFMLAALIAYYERKTTVTEICNQFGIAVSTIYDWKARIALHKDLMLGALISQMQRTHSYVLELLDSDDLSGILHRFFRKYGYSFMQHRSESAARSRPP